MTQNEQKKPLIEFPCIFPVKVIGEARPGLFEDICRCAENTDPACRKDTFDQRPSGKGKYLAVTVRVRAESQPQLDSLYEALGRIPGVRFVL